MDTIPLIPTVPESIKSAAREGKLIIFVGAGVSRILGCPSWVEFAEEYLKIIKDSGVIKNHFVYERLKEIGQRDPRKLLTICRTLIPKPNIKKIFDKDEKIKKEHEVIYDHLYAFNAVYVTTNFDTHLDDVLLKKLQTIQPKSKTGAVIDSAKVPAPLAEIVYKNEKILTTLLDNAGNIIHLHGSIEDLDSLIITFPEYARHYETGLNASELLRKASERTILFVGYGLEEYEILEYIVQKAGLPKPDSSREVEVESRHAMLFAAFEEEKELVGYMKDYYKHLGVQLVAYSKTQNGHAQLVDVLEQWSKEIGPIARPLGFLEKRKVVEGID